MLSREYLQRNLHLSDKLLSIRYSVSTTTIRNIRLKKGVSKPEISQRLFWTDEESQYLLDNSDMPNELIAFALNRSIRAINLRKVKYRIFPSGTKGI